MSPLEVTLLLALVALSGLFSALETGITNINPYRVKGEAGEGDWRAEGLLRLISRREEVITLCVIGNMVTLVAVAALSTNLAMEEWGPVGAALATVGSTGLLLTFGEILPKTFALTRGELLLTTFALPLTIALRFFGPVIRIPQLAHGVVARFTGAKRHQGSGVTRQDLETLLAREHVSLPAEDMQVLNRLFNFDRLTVREVMKPFTNVVMVARNATIGATIEVMRRSGFSRLPVYGGEQGDIIGMVHYVDLLFLDAFEGGIEPFLRPVAFVPEVNRIDTMLRQFQKGRFETAIVVNEYGAPSGLVTLEDVLEEIVGEIHDESDKRRPVLTPLGKRRYALSGDYEIDALNEALKAAIPKEGYETVAGLAQARLQKIPDEGEWFMEEGFKFTVVEMRHHRVVGLVMETPGGNG